MKHKEFYKMYLIWNKQEQNWERHTANNGFNKTFKGVMKNVRDVLTYDFHRVDNYQVWEFDLLHGTKIVHDISATKIDEHNFDITLIEKDKYERN